VVTVGVVHPKNSSVDVTVASINNPKSSSAKLAVNEIITHHLDYMNKMEINVMH
jgi:hypothetical protein